MFSRCLLNVSTGKIPKRKDVYLVAEIGASDTVCAFYDGALINDADCDNS